MYNDLLHTHKSDPLLDRIFNVSEDKEGLLEENKASHWSITWSDILFILFIILFVYAVVHNNSKISETEYKDTDSEQNNELFKITRDMTTDLEGVSVFLQEDRSVKLSIEGPLLFDTGKADLKPSAIRFLNRISDIIRKTDYKVNITGHTDNIPINTPVFESNWELSLMRGARVTRYLIEKAKLEPERFAVIGYSMYQPAAPNITPYQRALNRRVEIIITPDTYIE